MCIQGVGIGWISHCIVDDGSDGVSGVDGIETETEAEGDHQYLSFHFSIQFSIK